MDFGFSPELCLRLADAAAGEAEPERAWRLALETLGRGLSVTQDDILTQGGVVALIGVTEGKAAITVAVTSDMAGKVNAADLARVAVIAMGGQGAGGKPDFAQGGAPDGSKAEEGLAAVRTALAG